MDPKKVERKFDKVKGKPRKADKRVKDSKFPKDKDIFDKPYRKGPNDPEWRTSDTTMTELVARLPFGFPNGLAQAADYSVTNTKPEYVAPGIMTIPVTITAGTTKDYNSALNLAVRKIYSYVRHANSGSRNYEAADMGMYFVAIGQVLGLLSYLQRILRIAHEFKNTNRYTPRALLKQMGVDATDMMTNYAKLKYLIAWLGRAIGSLAFPDLPYFRAIYEGFKFVYVDNDSPKEQYYLITPYEIGKYDPTYSANGGGVHLGKGSVSPNIQLPDSLTPATYADLESIVKDRMDVLLGDEDCGIISGDILKAFDEGKLFKPEAFSLDYDVFMHSPEMLQQIHNLTALNQYGDLQYLGLKQNPGSTGTAPFIEQDINAVVDLWNGDANLACNTIIDAFSRIPDAKEVVNCMVLNPQIKIKPSVSAGKYQYDADTLSHDLFLPATPYICNNVATGASVAIGNTDKWVTQDGGITAAHMYMSNFDWHPIIWFCPTGDVFTLHPFGDVQNMRIFDYSVGERIHDNSILSLFAFSEHNFY